MLRDAASHRPPLLARAWRYADDHYLKPYLGGRVHRRSRAGSTRSQLFDSPNAVMERMTPSSARASMAGQPTEVQPQPPQPDADSSAASLSEEED